MSTLPQSKYYRAPMSHVDKPPFEVKHDFRPFLGVVFGILLCWGIACAATKNDPTVDIGVAKNAVVGVALNQHNAATDSDTHATAITSVVPTGSLSIAVGPHVAAIHSDNAIILKNSETLTTSVVPTLQAGSDGIDQLKSENAELTQEVHDNKLTKLGYSLLFGVGLSAAGVFAILYGSPRLGIAGIGSGIAASVLSVVFQKYALLAGGFGLVAILGVLVYIVWKYHKAMIETVQTNEFAKDGLATVASLGGEAEKTAKAVLGHIFGKGSSEGIAHDTQSLSTQAIVAKIRGKKVSKVRLASPIVK